jgi:hypothetical protein
MPTKRLRSKNAFFSLNAVDYSDQIVDLELVVETDAPTTFTGPEGRYFLRGTGLASVKASTLHRYLRSNPNVAAIPFVFGPGGETPSADNPVFTGTVTLGLEPNIKAGPYGETSTFTIDIECDDKPTEDLAP